MKKIISILLVFMHLLLLVGCQKVDDTDIPTQEKEKYNVIFYANEGGYISGPSFQKIEEGAKSEIVKAVANDGYEFVSWSDGVKDEKRILDNISSDIILVANYRKIVYEFPNIFIITENYKSITSKEVYVNCTFTVDDNKNPEFNMVNVPAKIRGRGNSTWDKPKKPYRLKFEEKVDLFGNGEGKDWTLIANYVDPSLIRNYLAYTIGSKMDDLSFTTSTKFANVYLNGDYQGLYLVCEQIKTGKNRVEINDSLDNNISFLVELDQRILDEGKVEGKDYFYVDNQPYGIKAPDTDDVEFKNSDCANIKNYLQNCLNVVKNNPYNEVKAIIDVNSFADGYIIHELFSSIDVNFSSWYMFKDKNGKLSNGPIWDFDISAGNVDYNDQAKVSNKLFANTNTWYKYLLRHKEFKELVSLKLYNYDAMIRFTIVEEINELMKYSYYFETNFKKWPILGKYTWPNPSDIVAIKTWAGQVEYVSRWLNDKLDYMESVYY